MKAITIISVFFVSGLFLPGLADITEDISAALRSGNSKELSRFFAPTVTLTILDEEDAYSREQAALIIKDFFTKNPPKAFSIVHKGTSKEGAQYVIGNLATAEKSYRTYFLLKKSGSTYIIDSLSFELDEDE